MRRPVRKAIFPVGGLGTRFLPATKAMPKEMLPVVDKPLIQYAVEEAKAAGIEEFIFVTGRGKTAIENHFDREYELEAVLESRGKEKELKDLASLLLEAGSVTYMRQQEPLGLGHAVWCARNAIGDEPFAVLLADDLIQAGTPCLKQMIDSYQDTGGHLVAVMDVPREQTNRYGILDVVSENGPLAKAKSLIEKPAPEVAPSTLSIIGRYVLDPSVFRELDKKERGAGGEIQLTDALAATLDNVDFHGLRFEGTRFDCGSKAGFLEATIAFALEREDLGGRMRDILNKYTK
ncbi:UTP--glucose-1-phosphate uridylyltransferase [Kiloniella spongiae]|uniref:UTP--glucose-1-phosphate uridylyltransferase n=1 Tax=Kiloniella spongiae TaxID=1489064 RepID=A0A0H2MAI8_9PROT|nr:UTP--glucose-1-phosphate uridylyltransferase GalU [Kiloniella spongiae]KLN59524.1 UTP--glucose-1-phosphate uridylyltransferase [Kiloniella spongiae]